MSKYTYYYWKETGQQSQTFENVTTAVYFAIEDRDQGTAKFEMIVNGEGETVCSNENFQEIYNEHTVNIRNCKVEF